MLHVDGDGMYLAQVYAGLILDRLGRKLLDVLPSVSDYLGIELRSRASLELPYKTGGNSPSFLTQFRF